MKSEVKLEVYKKPQNTSPNTTYMVSAFVLPLKRDGAFRRGSAAPRRAGDKPHIPKRCVTYSNPCYLVLFIYLTGAYNSAIITKASSHK